MHVDPGSFTSTVRNIADLKRGALVPQIGRFAAHPRLEDLRELTLDPTDVEEINKCKPERCGLKLAPEEIAQLQGAVSDDHGDSRALDNAFRQVVLERAKAYLLRGDDITKRQFSLLIQHSPYVEARAPQVAAYLDRYPAARLSGAESFLYWSKEAYTWKPMITVTHVTILRGGVVSGSPEVMVVSRDIFATRYTSGSFILTMLFRDAGAPSKRYLVYINRTWVDGVRALWRPFVEYRIKTQARRVFAGVRERIEQDTPSPISQ